MITNDANTLVFSNVLSTTLEDISILSVSNSNGEFFRKAITSITDISAQKKRYTVYLADNDANDSIVSVGLHGNGATVTLNSGTCFATQPLVLSKNNKQSLTIEWTLEVL